MAMASSQRKDLHRAWQTEGVCEKVLKGIVHVGFRVGNCAGAKSAHAYMYMYMGWNSVSQIYVEEVHVPPLQA